VDQDREELLDQVVFRWEGNRGRTGTGINAVAYSCDGERAEELRAELAPLLRVEGGDLPSQVRQVRRTGEVVVINRRRDPDAHGRSSTESHALIGSRGALKPRFCLALSQLPVPVADLSGTDVRRLPRAKHTELKETAGPEGRRFMAQVPTVAAPLTAMVAQLLRTPAHLMSVRIPDFSREGENDTPLLIWGLSGVFGSWLGRDFWTYATYDTSDTHGLRVVGVPDWRTSAIEDPLLERIAFHNAPDDEAQWIARGLVTLFLSDPDGAEAVQGLISQCPDAVTLPLPDRLHMLRRLLESATVSGAGVSVLRPMSPLGLSGADRLPPSAVGDRESAGGPEARQAPRGEAGADPRGERPIGPLPSRPRGNPAHRPPPAPVPTAHGSAEDEPADHGSGAVRRSAPTAASPRSEPSAAARHEPAPGPATVPPSVTPRPSPDVDPCPRPQAPTTFRSPVRPPGKPSYQPSPARAADPEDSLGADERVPGSRPPRPLPPRLTRRRSLLHRVTFARWRYDRHAGPEDTDRRPDGDLLAILRRPGLSRGEVDRLLDALAARANLRTLGEADRVCRDVLEQELYLPGGRRAGDGKPDEREQYRAAETAAWLLHWAVLPYLEHRGVGDRVGELFRKVCTRDGRVERHFLDVLVFSAVHGPPKLPTQAWMKLVGYLRTAPEGRPPQVLRKPSGHAAGRRTAPARGHRAQRSDDLWKVACMAMSCVAALLLLLLIARW
jgi:hypothetical protein